MQKERVGDRFLDIAQKLSDHDPVLAGIVVTGLGLYAATEFTLAKMTASPDAHQALTIAAADTVALAALELAALTSKYIGKSGDLITLNLS